MKPFEDKMSFPNREEITEQHEFRTPAEESEEAATPEPTLPCTNFAKVEKSLASLGFFTPSSRRLRNAKVKKITFTREIDGKRVEVTAEIVPSTISGLPITADQDKYLALQEIVTDIIQSEGQVTNPIRFKSADLIRLLKNDTNAGKNYKEIYEWLNVMTSTTIVSNGVVYIAGQKRYVRDRFHVFDRAVSVGRELEDGSIADANYVWFSSWQLDNINHNYLLPIDLESYRQLKNHIAKALVPLLQIWLFASHKAGSFEKRYEELCEILDVAKHRAPSLISRQLKPSLDELVHHGYLEKWRIEKTSDLKAYKVILFHGPKFHRDRRKRIEQKSQTSELIIVAQSESPDKPISLELGKLESALQEAAAEEMPMTRARAATRRSAPIEKPEKAARESRSTMAAEGKTSDFESVLLDELVARGLIASATVNLLNSLPPDRLNSVRDYIEYWDFVRAGKKVGPGFLYDLIRNGKPLPPTFETNKQRAERKAKEERQGQLIMAKQSLEFAYDEYRQNTTDRFLSEQFPKNEIERRIKEKKAEFNSQRGIWGNRPDLNDRMAWHSVRAEIGEQVPLLSFQEFCRREASRILADYQIDPAELDISVSLP